MIPRRSHRPRPPTDQDVADWCDALARRLRAGDTLTAAVTSAAAPEPVVRSLAPVLLALDRGASLSTAVLTARHRSSALDTAVTVISACATLGGPAAEPLDRVAATMRRRVADTADRRAQSAQARLSALTLTVLPAGVLFVLAITSAPVRHGITTTAGAVGIGVGLALNGLGWWWMRRIIGARP
jgi:tight adherence protein B